MSDTVERLPEEGGRQPDADLSCCTFEDGFVSCAVALFKAELLASEGPANALSLAVTVYDSFRNRSQLM